MRLKYRNRDVVGLVVGSIVRHLYDNGVRLLRRRSRFSVVLALLLLAGFLVTSLISHHVARSSLGQEVQRSTLPLTSDNIYSEIQRDLLRPILLSSVMAQDTFLRDWAIAGEADAEPIVKFLKEVQDRYDSVTAYFVSEATRSYYHPSGVLKTVDVDDRQDAWYFRAREMVDDYEVNVDVDTADLQRTTVFINYRVVDYDDNLLGIVGLGLELTDVTELIDSYQQRYGRQVYFADREGTITLAGGNTTYPQRIEDRPGLGSARRELLSQASASVSYHNGNETIYANSRYVPEFDWYLLVEQPSSQLEAKLTNTLFVNVAISLLVSMVFWFILHATIGGYQRRLEHMASTDKLTGAANRQTFEHELTRALDSASTSAPLALVMLDIDNFKSVNDRYGHLGGDAVLQQIAAAIRSEIRTSDRVCRWGGEEFLLLLPSCKVEQATRIANSILRTIRRSITAYDNVLIAVTASLGVAVYEAGDSEQDLIGRADAAMYRAKHQGRDRVVVARTSDDQALDAPGLPAHA